MTAVRERVRRLTAPQYRAYWVLGISGLLGFRLGMVGYPTWQVAVEPAQVVAGLVSYPPGNTFYLYQTKLWTILHQINALFLLAGVSEITLSRAISGLLGMVGLQALAMVTYALGRDAMVAIGVPVFAVFTRATSNGSNYPIDIMGTQHTYGSLGLSMAVLITGLFGSGCYGLGAFLLGLMPAIHPSLGAWLWLVVAIAAAWDWRRLWGSTGSLRSTVVALVPFAAGAAVATASLAYHLLFTVDVPAVSAEVTRPYFEAFMAFWDGHRAGVLFQSGAVALNRAALAIGVIWLLAFARDLPHAGLFLLRIVVVSAVLSLLFVAVSWIPNDRLPVTFMVLMPGRLVNLNAMAFVAVLAGLISAYRRSPGGPLLLLAFIAGLLLTGRSMLWLRVDPSGWIVGRHPLNPLLTYEALSVGVLLVALLAWRRARTAPGSALNAPLASVTRTVYLAAIALLFWIAVLTMPVKASTGFYRDRFNDPFFAAVAAEKDGLVLTAGSYEFVQLYTRRPVLMTGPLDILPYVPEAGPEMQRILMDVYGVDLFHPPPEARGLGTLPRAVHRHLWEQNTRARWIEIGRTYHVTQVVVPIDWTLDLPLVMADRFRLYSIPRE